MQIKWLVWALDIPTMLNARDGELNRNLDAATLFCSHLSDPVFDRRTRKELVKAVADSYHAATGRQIR